MVQGFLTALLLVTSTVAAHGAIGDESPQDLFLLDDFNDLHEDGKFLEAVELGLSIEATIGGSAFLSENEKAAFQYHLGDALAGSDNPEGAIPHFQLSATDLDARENGDQTLLLDVLSALGAAADNIAFEAFERDGSNLEDMNALAETSFRSALTLARRIFGQWHPRTALYINQMIDYYAEFAGDVVADEERLSLENELAELNKRGHKIYEPGEDVTTRSGSESERYNLVDVFYSTGRQPTEKSGGEIAFGARRDDRSARHYGTVTVSIPHLNHSLGEIERPNIWSMELRPDPDKHMVAGAPAPLSTREFYQSLKQKIAISRESEALLFVHGFNVSFEEAALRTAQISKDLDFKGAPMMFSWPTRGLRKEDDRGATSFDQVTENLAAFVSSLKTRGNVKTVHIISHGLGAMFAVNAIREATSKSDGSSLPQIGQLALVAPDISKDDLIAALPVLEAHTTRTTLHASSKDRVLNFSGMFRSQPPVMFDPADGKELLAIGYETFDTIDTADTDTNFMGEGGTVQEFTLIAEVSALVLHNLKPALRCYLEKNYSGSAPFYRVDSSQCSARAFQIASTMTYSLGYEGALKQARLSGSYAQDNENKEMWSEVVQHILADFES